MEMQYRRLGSSGLKVSALSYGSWVTFSSQLDLAAACECLTVAYDAGVNFFDNAEIYADGESERLMGRALERLGWGRDTYCVSSKAYWGGNRPTQLGLSRKHLFDACHGALRRLRVDYLDLYFCHRPDLETPVEETVRAMHDLVQQGKVMYWGTSEWSAQQIQEAYGTARQYGLTPPTMEQPQYNLFVRDKVEREYHRLYSEIGLGTTVWSPLASGILTGKYRDGIPPDTRMSMPDLSWLRDRIESEEGREQIRMATEVGEIAKGLGISLAELALAWCLKNENVSTVIMGASQIEQLRQNLSALDALALLTDEVLAKIETILQNRPELPVQF